MDSRRYLCCIGIWHTQRDDANLLVHMLFLLACHWAALGQQGQVLKNSSRLRGKVGMLSASCLRGGCEYDVMPSACRIVHLLATYIVRFANDEMLIGSKSVPDQVMSAWMISTALSIKPLLPAQQVYMEYHRAEVFLG